jgi:hypothetical protein
MVTGLAIVGAIALLAASCSLPSKPKKTLPGTWFGYLSYQESTGGYNTMTITADRSCTLVGQVSGQSDGWGGSYTLLFQGDPTILTNRILGEITITRQRPGIDTVQVSGYWSGDIVLEEESMYGIWVTDQGAAFYAEGFWGANKQDEGGSGH